MSSNQKNSFVANKRDRKKLDLNAKINPKQQKTHGSTYHYIFGCFCALFADSTKTWQWPLAKKCVFVHFWAKNRKVRNSCMNQPNTLKQNLHILTSCIQKAYQALNHSAFDLYDGSAIVLKAKHACKCSNNEQNCETQNHQSNSTKKQQLRILT